MLSNLRVTHDSSSRCRRKSPVGKTCRSAFDSPTWLHSYPHVPLSEARRGTLRRAHQTPTPSLTDVRCIRYLLPANSTSAWTPLKSLRFLVPSPGTHHRAEQSFRPVRPESTRPTRLPRLSSELPVPRSGDLDSLHLDHHATASD